VVCRAREGAGRGVPESCDVSGGGDGPAPRLFSGLDLFVPVLTFVFGQAQLKGPGALLSTFRLRNEFYGLPADPYLLLDRTIKEAVHELGHSFGLVHCHDPACVMSSSTYVEEVDLKSDWYCSECEGLLLAGTTSAQETGGP
jgi:archaemetzincin